jgi:hypothetical protein
MFILSNIVDTAEVLKNVLTSTIEENFQFDSVTYFIY